MAEEMQERRSPREQKIAELIIEFLPDLIGTMEFELLIQAVEKDMELYEHVHARRRK